MVQLHNWLEEKMFVSKVIFDQGISESSRIENNFENALSSSDVTDTRTNQATSV